MAKNRQGQPSKSKVEALDAPHQNAGFQMALPGTLDDSRVATDAGRGACHAATPHEVKEWQAIMDHLSRLPVKNQGELLVIPTEERAIEVRAVQVGDLCDRSPVGQGNPAAWPTAAHPDRHPCRPAGAKPPLRLTPTVWRDWTKVQHDAGAPQRSLHALWERLPIEGDALIAAAHRETDLKPTQNG